MAGTISQRISLEGAEDIKRKLETLGQAGEQAFNQLEEACAGVSEALGSIGGAGETAAEGVGAISEASQEIGEALGEVTEQANKATEAVSKFGLENIKTGSEIAKNAAEFAKTGVEIGLLVTRHESLFVALTKMALGAGVASTGLEVLVGTLGAAAVAIGGVVIGIGAAAAAFAAFAAAAAAAAEPYEKLSSTLETLAQNTGTAFEELQRGQALFELLGVSAESFGSIVTKIAAELKALDIGEAFKKSADDLKKATNDVLVAEKELLELQIKLSEEGRLQAPIGARERILELDKQIKDQLLELEAAEDKLANARVRAAEAAANSLSKVVEQIKAIIEGQKGITFDPLTKGETIIKALAVAMKQAAENGKVASTVLLQFIASADRLNALAAGAKFGLSEDDVDRIRRAGAAAGGLEDILKRLDASGVIIPPEAAESFRKMREQIEATERAQIRLNQAWDSSIFARFGADVTSILEKLKADFLNATAGMLESFNKFVAALPAAVDLSMAQVKEVWFAAWAAMAEGVATFFDTIGLDSIAARLREFAEGFKQSADEAATASEAAAQKIREAWDQSLKATGESAQKTGKLIIETFGEVADAAEPAAQKSASAWETFKNSVIAAIQAVINKLRELLGLQSRAGAAPPAAGGGGGLPMAGGGLMGGRGTGTSDSNLAWLSRGEYITPARAVRQPGVLAFLEALRRSGGNLSRVLDGMGRFALGGMVVPHAIPAFAKGGLNGGGSSRVLNLTIGTETFGGLSVPEHTAQALERFAVYSQIASTGRKPSWKR